MINLAWVNPTTRTDGTPADQNQTVEFLIAPVPPVTTPPTPPTYSTLGESLPGASTASFPNPAPGSYIIQGIVVDTQNPPQDSTSVTSAPFSVPAPVTTLAAPNPISNLSVTVDSL